MRVLVIAIVTAILMGAGSLASAQQAPAPAPGAENSKQDRPAAARDKRRACREEGQSKGSRGPDLQDYVAVCVAEARLACLKQAVEQKVRGAARRDFMAKCLSS
jgi:psiF repeat